MIAHDGIFFLPGKLGAISYTHTKEDIKKIVPARRLGKPEEIAGLVCYLLSENAGYITRQVISINGGVC